MLLPQKDRLLWLKDTGGQGLGAADGTQGFPGPSPNSFLLGGN